MNRAATGAAGEAAADDRWARPERGHDDPATAPVASGAAAVGGAIDGGGDNDRPTRNDAAADDDERWADDRPADRPADRRAADDRFGPDRRQLDDLNQRNPPRDWAAPPPWLASDERRRAESNAEPPPFLGRRATDPGRGLAGSQADLIAGGRPPSEGDDEDESGVWSSDSRSAAAAAAGLTGESAGGARASGRRPPARRNDDLESYDEDADDEPRRAGRRPRAYAQHLGGPDGPDWERPRRYEAYPTIRTRVSMPAIPRLVGLVALVGVLALALFLLPGFLNIGGTAAPPASSAGPSAVAGPSVSLAPTEPPAPTPSIYTIKKGETLSKIATAHGITIEELLAANPAIKNPNKISEGQQIVIPVPSEAPPDEVGESTEP